MSRKNFRMNEKIIYLRKIFKNTQKDFAKGLQISQATLSKIENNETTVDVEIVRKLIKKYKISGYWLFDVFPEKSRKKYTDAMLTSYQLYLENEKNKLKQKNLLK